MRSSYIKNNYGDVLYSIVTGFRPINAVELGVLDGYSAVHIGRGMKRNKECPRVPAVLDAYDLFEDYQYKHGTKEAVEEEIKTAGVSDFVRVIKGDAYKVHDNYADNSVYMLHVDISNTGEVVRRIMEAWHRKMVIGGIILFEGGTEERDREQWMVQYNKEPMKPEFEKNKIIEDYYIFGTYLPWPGLTMLLRKR